MNDDMRNQFVPFNQEKMEVVANFCNRFPQMELLVEGQHEHISVFTDDPEELNISICVKREIDEADYDSKEEYEEELQIFKTPVDAPLFPAVKDEIWWVVIGSP